MCCKQYPQLPLHGELIPLLFVEDLSRDLHTLIPDTAVNFVSRSDYEIKKVLQMRCKNVLKLSFENSTRTQTTFQIATTRRSADVINQCRALSCHRQIGVGIILRRSEIAEGEVPIVPLDYAIGDTPAAAKQDRNPFLFEFLI